MAMNKWQDCVEEIKERCTSKCNQLEATGERHGVVGYAGGKRKVLQEILDIIAKYE